MPRTGRPPIDNPRKNMLNLRLSDDELAIVQAAADAAGEALGPYARTVLLRAAKRSKRPKASDRHHELMTRPNFE